MHEGHYQCNNNHRHATGSHMLHVHGKESSSTESGYQTIDEMTPSSPNEIFTNTWKEQQQQPHKLHKQPTQQHYPNSAFGNASSDYGMVFGYAPPHPLANIMISPHRGIHLHHRHRMAMLFIGFIRQRHQIFHHHVLV